MIFALLLLLLLSFSFVADDGDFSVVFDRVGRAGDSGGAFVVGAVVVVVVIMAFIVTRCFQCI